MSSYCLKFLIYAGKEDRFISGEGFTFNIVNELLSDCQYKYHIVYIDNYHTSPKLARYLLSTRTDLVGTIKRMCRGVPRIGTILIGHGDDFKVASTSGLSIYSQK